MTVWEQLAAERVSFVQRNVMAGRLTAGEGAMLLALARDIDLARQRRAFLRGFLDGLSGGPLWRLIARRLRR